MTQGGHIGTTYSLFTEKFKAKEKQIVTNWYPGSTVSFPIILRLLFYIISNTTLHQGWSHNDSCCHSASTRSASSFQIGDFTSNFITYGLLINEQSLDERIRDAIYIKNTEICNILTAKLSFLKSIEWFVYQRVSLYQY